MHFLIFAYAWNWGLELVLESVINSDNKSDEIFVKIIAQECYLREHILHHLPFDLLILYCKI